VCRLVVIGMADSLLSESQKSLLKSCSFVFGAQRFKDLLPTEGIEFFPITPLSDALKTIGTLLPQGNVAILASGDPLFYGIGRKLLQLFTKEHVEFYPALSSLQRACALFKIAWDDAKIVSLHGRKETHIATTLLQSSKTIVFTDKTNSPNTLALALINYFKELKATEFMQKVRFLVAEDIGIKSQKVSCCTLEECAGRHFSSLNVLCILAPFIDQKQENYNFGLTEETIQHSRGLITKNEVRAATLHTLRLPAHGVLWDVGAGSGSISIEAARSNPDLTVYAVEHKEEEIENIRRNICKYRCFNVVPVFGRAPEILNDLPRPDRIFVGGSSGSLMSLVRLAAERLPADGRIVVNGVIAKTIEAAPIALQKFNFSITSSTVTVSRESHTQSPTVFNPITIITGTR
jgi:precorrin-6Y C5,15-methyltransferase (decarboxylating)